MQEIREVCTAEGKEQNVDIKFYCEWVSRKTTFELIILFHLPEYDLFLSFKLIWLIDALQL